MTVRFAGRTAIVTGGSRGIGLAVARRLVDDGAKVLITGRSQEALDVAVAQLGGPDRACAVAGDAADPQHRALAVARAVQVFGSVDLLVNNAGISPPMNHLMTSDLATVRTAIDVNAVAPLGWVIQAYDAWMRAHGGAIVNISSLTAVRHIAGLGPYGMGKAMLAHLTGQLAVELGPGVRVNAVAPAMVKTRLAAGRYEGHEDELARSYPLKRLGIPSDIGGAVTFLLSEEASWITGQHLLVDGGKALLGTVGAEDDPSGALEAAGQLHG